MRDFQVQQLIEGNMYKVYELNHKENLVTLRMYTELRTLADTFIHTLLPNRKLLIKFVWYLIVSPKKASKLVLDLWNVNMDALTNINKKILTKENK